MQQNSPSPKSNRGILAYSYLETLILMQHEGSFHLEDSENRIKELKLDFGGDILPCSDFGANALYFMISTLSFNLLALLRLFLPEELAHHRAITIRWRLYAIAAKLVKTGRQFFIKMKEKHHVYLKQY